LIERPVQQEGDGVNPLPPLQFDLCLEFCSKNDPRYQRIRKRHYVVYRGVHGQQIHFLIRHHSKIVGIISGASPVYATLPRDNFFGITKQNRQKCLNGIIDNVLFRLEKHEPNLASRCLSIWRKVTALLWEDLYQVPVFGFETFIDEVRAGYGFRDAALYKADNWMIVGETSGSTKHHGSEGLTGGLQGKSFARRIVPKKQIVVKWREGYHTPQEYAYKSSWKTQTEEERQRAKILAHKRKDWVGVYFTAKNHTIFQKRGDSPWLQLLLSVKPTPMTEASHDIKTPIEKFEK
jgi:hypothetical protein